VRTLPPTRVPPQRTPQRTPHVAPRETEETYTMRPGHRLRCDRCRASVPTRAATLTATSILCPACAALLPPPAAHASADTGDNDATGRRSVPRLVQTG